MVEPRKHVRNVAIIVALAVAFWQVPGGGTASNVIANLLSVVLLGGMAFFAYRMYMEHRVTILGLEDRTRAVLYASVGLAVFAVVATSRLWNEGGPYVLIWFAMLGAAAYGVYAAFRSSREY